MTAPVLVLHTGGLGDLLVSMPALLAIGAPLDVRGRLDFLEVLDGCEPRPRIASFERPGIHHLFSEPGRAPADIASDLPAARVVVSFLGEPGGPLERNLLSAGARAVVTVAVPRRDARGAPHATVRVRDGLERTGLRLAPHERLRLAPREPEHRAAAKALDAIGRPHGCVLLVHPGSGGANKNWPLERFLSIARGARSRLGLDAVAVTGPADEPLALRLAREAPDVPRIESPPIGVLLALLGAARLYLGNDSGVSHLAAAAGVAGAAVFGPSDPLVWAPDSPRVAALRAGDSPDAITEDDVMRALAAAIA